MALFGLLAAMLLMQTTSEQHKRIVQITVLRLPPLPKPEERPPERPKDKEEPRLEQPPPAERPQADPSPPPLGSLGVDAQGSGSGDGFDVLGRPGGHDITLGASGSPQLGLTAYANAAARFIALELGREEQLRALNYQVELLVWIGHDGRLEKFTFARGTGDPKIDALIRDGLARVGAFPQRIPEKLPQPMRVRVTSTGA